MSANSYHQLRTDAPPPPAGCPVRHDWDPLSDEYLDDPYDAAHRLRDETPIFHAPSLGYVVVNRMDDVVEVFSDPDTYSSTVVQDPVFPLADRATDVLAAAYVLDATGLQADVTTHPLYADLIARSGARRNPKGRLAVEPTFEIVGTRSGSGRMYAAGAMTLGGAYAGVDSFLGLQYAALQAADDMADLGALPRIGPWRSARGWCAWALGRPTQPDRRDQLDRRDGRDRADRRRRSAVVAS